MGSLAEIRGDVLVDGIGRATGIGGNRDGGGEIQRSLQVKKGGKKGGPQGNAKKREREEGGGIRKARRDSLGNTPGWQKKTGPSAIKQPKRDFRPPAKPRRRRIIRVELVGDWGEAEKQMRTQW